MCPRVEPDRWGKGGMAALSTNSANILTNIFCEDTLRKEEEEADDLKGQSHGPTNASEDASCKLSNLREEFYAA